MSNRREIWASLIGPLIIGWRILVSNQPRAIILAAGSVSIALAATALTSAAVTSHAIVAQTVDAGWRGAYDILVRPVDATTYAVRGKQLVPVDFLAVRSSGITRRQWQAIARIPGVEVAAPLATLGWMRSDVAYLRARFAIPGPEELIRVDATIEDADGTVQRDGGYFGFDYETSGDPERAIATFHDYTWDAASADVGLSLTLPSAWGDVVGIDPVEENQLIGLDGYVTGQGLERGLTTRFDEAYGLTATRVPVITPGRIDWRGQVTMTITEVTGVEIKAITQALEASPLGPYDVTLIEQLTRGAPTTILGSNTAALGDLVQPLRGTLVTFVDGQFQSGEGGVSASGRNVLLLPGEAQYGFEPDGSPTLDGLGTWGELVEPAIDAAQPRNFIPPSASLNDMLQYRPLTVTVPDPFMVDALGTYDLEAISARYAGASNYVPLGIYGDPARRLMSDLRGNPRDEPLPVSLNPGGLNPLPPIGLTNLESVEALRGEDFIDAIRVRVADITSYTPPAVAKIEQVAAAIRDRTGLHIDVVAGSSPVDVKVAVSGVGTVRERWTTLGEAPRIITGAEGLSGLLLGSAALVVILYLGSFGVFLVDDQRRGIEILRQVGWRRGSRTWLLVGQALLLGLAAAALSVALLAVIDVTTEISPPPLAYPASAFAVIAAHMLATGLAALTGRTQRERVIGEPARWPSVGIIGLGLRNSVETPRRLVTVAVALALAILVAGTIAAVEAAYGGELRATVLGEVVWLRVGWYHVLAAGAALFAAASIALDSGVLAVERRIGLIALLRATGWRARAITGVVSVEAGLPAFAGGLLAVLPVVGVGVWVGLGLPGLLILSTAAVVLGALVAIVVAALPARLALAVDPARGLAAEGMTGALPGFASRAALATVVALAVFVSAAGVGYGVLAPVAIPPNAFVPVPTAAPPSAAAIALSAHVEAVAARSDRTAGSTNFDWTFRYIADSLSTHGGRTSNQAFTSNRAQWFDAEGAAVDASVVRLEVAVVPGFDSDTPLPFTAATGEQSDCVPGVIVLRTSESDAATRPFDLLSRCAAVGMSAALAVMPLSDEAWNAISGAASVTLSSGRILWATVGTPTYATPLVVVPVGSTGPGAAESAAPIAVALELAAIAQAAGQPLRLAFADLGQPGTMPFIVRRVAETMPGAQLIELGPLGGRLAAVLGERWTDPLDEASTRVGLLRSVLVDDGASAWVERTATLTPTDTSTTLLSALAGGSAPTDVRLEGVISPSALAIGIDAAYLGEPFNPDTNTGTPADTPDQVDIAALEETLGQLASALEVLDD